MCECARISFAGLLSWTIYATLANPLNPYSGTSILKSILFILGATVHNFFIFCKSLSCCLSFFSYKSQSNFWLSFQKFLYAGIAYCYRLFRHFSLWKIFSNLLISPYVLVFKSSMWSSKFSVYYLCNQPLHFCYRRFGSRMRVIVQRHIDVGMSHDVLQCFRVHSRIC